MILSLLFATTANAQSTLVLSAGPSESAAWIAAGDLVEAGRQCGTKLDLATSSGAMDSLEALKGTGEADAAIVQGDVLDYLQSYLGQDPKIAQAVDGVELATPLFEQELHVIARADIAEMADLTGKRVNVGPLTSGGFLTATIVLDFLGIQPGEATRLPASDALTALRKGALDAVFLVDSAPSRLLLDSGLDAEEAHLLDVQDTFLSEVYLNADIPAGTYDFEPAPHQSIAVRSFLMTRAAPIQSPACNAIANTVAIITQKRNLLVTQGHKKWSDLDQSTPTLDWPLSPCAVAGLDPSRPLTCQ